MRKYEEVLLKVSICASILDKTSCFYNTKYFNNKVTLSSIWSTNENVIIESRYRDNFTFVSSLEDYLVIWGIVTTTLMTLALIMNLAEKLDFLKIKRFGSEKVSEVRISKKKCSY